MKYQDKEVARAEEEIRSKGRIGTIIKMIEGMLSYEDMKKEVVLFKNYLAEFEQTVACFPCSQPCLFLAEKMDEHNNITRYFKNANFFQKINFGFFSEFYLTFRIEGIYYSQRFYTI